MGPVHDATVDLEQTPPLPLLALIAQYGPQLPSGLSHTYTSPASSKSSLLSGPHSLLHPAFYRRARVFSPNRPFLSAIFLTLVAGRLLTIPNTTQPLDTFLFTPRHSTPTTCSSPSSLSSPSPLSRAPPPTVSHHGTQGMTRWGHS